MFERLSLRQNGGDVPQQVGADVPQGQGERVDEVQPVDVLVPAEESSRFELDPDQNQDSWELPNDQLQYIHKYLKIHVPEKDLKDNIVNFHPAPSNLRVVPELDGYIRTILSNNNKAITLSNDKTLKGIQEKIQYLFGPLLKIWCAIDQDKELHPEDENILEISQTMDQAVLLLGQVQNTVSYHRRENVLSTLIDTSIRVKEILKNQSNDLNLSSNKFLFGEEFESKLLKDTKTIKKSESVFTGLKPSSSTAPRSRLLPAGGKRPFLGGSLSTGRGRGHQQRPGFSFRGKKISSFKNINLSCTSKAKFHSSTKTTSPGKTRSFLCAPSDKITASLETSPRPTKGRSNKVLFEKSGETNPGSRNTENGSGVSNTFCVNPKANSNSPISKHVKGRDITSGSGDRTNVGKESYRDCSFSKQKSVPKFPVSSFQKGWGEQTSDKSEVSKSTHSLSSFQDGKLVITAVSYTHLTLPTIYSV